MVIFIYLNRIQQIYKHVYTLQTKHFSGVNKEITISSLFWYKNGDCLQSVLTNSIQFFVVCLTLR